MSHPHPRSLLFACASALCLAGCDPSGGTEEVSSTGATSMSFEEFAARTYREPHSGVYVYNGDETAESLEELRAVYEARFSPRGVGVREDGLAVYHLGGADVRWTAAQALNLTYCVSTGFGTRYAAVVDAMARAADAWQVVANVRFIHQAAQDGQCSAGNSAVLFDVSPVSSNGAYYARAFFPNAGRAARSVLIDPSAFSDPTWTLTGILRHELGHVLGFRHEHTRPEAGTLCFEDASWRALTPYDAASVMHYPQCNGTNRRDLVLTQRDGTGAAALYPIPAPALVGPLTAQLAGDFNGDGRSDTATFDSSNGTWWVSLSTGWGFTTRRWADFNPSSGWTSQVVGDFNRDGRSDIANFHPTDGTWWVSLSTGSGFNTALWADFSTNSGWTAQVAGDFNGDGRSDIANFHPADGTWWVSLSTGSGFSTTLWADFKLDSGWTTQVAGDFNGDGRSDVASFHPADGTWWVSLSTGSGFNTTLWADFSPDSGWVSHLGDFNGDGRSDIANFHPTDGAWWVSLSTGATFSTTLWADYNPNSGWVSRVGDFNDDGRSDVASFHPADGTWWVSRSTGAAFSTALWADFSTNSGWTTQVAGDFNGDGRSDIANFHPTDRTWWVSLSTGAAFSTGLWADF